ncbi:MAG: phosphoribosyl-AMP cyclohydrolase [Candidatus Hadarchaeales archaeon]
MKLSRKNAEAVIEELEFKDGLVTAIVRDCRSGDILMAAFQNREAVLKTLTEGMMYYWSRSRGKLWRKGEISGHVQRLKNLRVDCDGDAILYDVEQVGAACHEGYRSCFFRRIRDGKLKAFMKRKFKPEDVYGKG